MIVERRGASRTYLGFALIGVVLSSALAYSGAALVSTPPSKRADNLAQLVNLLKAQNSPGNANGTVAPYALVGLNTVAVYAKTSKGVVTIQGYQPATVINSTILGSGFVVSFGGEDYVLTNYHVVNNATGVTVSFWDGDQYPATLVGYDAYSDYAVLKVPAPSSDFAPLQVASSTGVRVGQPVVAIGNPFGLSGSMTYGIISQLGRTIGESLAGNFAIADLIQFSAQVNPGSYGGPLLSADGTVIGMVTGNVTGSQGIGFAVPSDALLRELPSLVSSGTYQMHSYIGIESVDMNYQLAQAEGTNVTYGLMVAIVINGTPASTAGLRGGDRNETIEGVRFVVGGDVIVSINSAKLLDREALSAYLEENTSPGQSVVLGIIRGGVPLDIDLVLAARPPPP
jgi:S1-C subfamily serine protease